MNDTIKEKIVKITKNFLYEKFAESQKHSIRDYGNRLNFACPFCLDSQDDLRAKRGNLYLDYNIYKCFNDGCSASFLPILKYLNYTNGMSEFDFDDVDDLATKTISRKNFRNVSNENLKKLLIPRNVFKEKYNLSEVVPTHKFYNELKNRNCLQFKNKFLLGSDKIYVLNCDANGDVFGCQVRNFAKGMPKYTTKRYTELIKDFPTFDKGIKNEDVLAEIDKKSTIFSIFEIDLDEDLTVFEGPIDSLFFPKSVSFAGIDRIIDSANFRYFLDNDKAGYEKSTKLLLNGRSVFLWKTFLENYPKFAGVKSLKDILKLDKKFLIDNPQFSNCVNMADIKQIDANFENNYPQFKLVKDLNDIYKIDPNFDVTIFENFFSTSEFDLFFL